MSILCMLGRHDFITADGHPDSRLGYCIQECTKCGKAVARDPNLGGSFPILNTEATVERDAANAAKRNPA